MSEELDSMNMFPIHMCCIYDTNIKWDVTELCMLSTQGRNSVILNTECLMKKQSPPMFTWYVWSGHDTSGAQAHDLPVSKRTLYHSLVWISCVVLFVQYWRNHCSINGSSFIWFSLLRLRTPSLRKYMWCILSTPVNRMVLCW